jgi:hypothetical protein
MLTKKVTVDWAFISKETAMTAASIDKNLFIEVVICS